jgi:hypothetical protein
MFNGWFGLGRAYKKLPPHHDYKELAANVETLANYLIDKGADGSETGHLTWQWKLGNDLKLLLQYADGFVPPETDGLHYFSGRGREKAK